MRVILIRPELSNAKISESHIAILLKKYIFRFDIAMDDV